MKYALINDNNIVVNVVLWDGESVFDTQPQTSLVPLSETDDVSPGYRYENGAWISNEPPTPIIDIPGNPSIVAAKLTALDELLALGVTESAARIIVGL